MMFSRRTLLAAGSALPFTATPARTLATETAVIDAVSLAGMVRRGDISSLEAVDAAIDRSEALNPTLNFLVTETYQRAREKARKGRRDGPFAGTPLLVKDLTDVAGVPTRAGSRSTAANPPAMDQSPYIDALERAGAVIFGKSSTPEFGASCTTEPLAFGATRNPWNLALSPGGSSGGAAAAVAAGILPMAHANDGGGSIRIPAAACGLVGLKPSRGRTLSAGRSAARIATASDHCVSRTVRDTAALLAVTEAHEPSALFMPVGLVEEPSLRRLRIAMIAVSPSGEAPDAETERALVETESLLKALGHDVRPGVWPFPTPDFTRTFGDYWITAAARHVGRFEAASGRLAGPEDFEPVFLDMARSAEVSPEGVDRLVAELLAAAKAYEDGFADHDLILSPVVAHKRLPLGEMTGRLTWSEMSERFWRYVGYTPIQNISGAPAISLPLGWTADGLPIGIHFGARSGDERTLLELAFELEAAQPWGGRRPNVFAS
jgi:amidase